MSLKTRPVETVANPPVVENLPADIVSLAEAQSLGHQTFQLTVAEPVRRNDNSPCLNCKSVSSCQMKIRNRKVFGKRTIQ